MAPRRKDFGKVLGAWLAPALKATPQSANESKSDPYMDQSWPAIAHHPDGRLMTRDERVERAHTDRLFFGKCYFPHYFGYPEAAFHREWCDTMAEMRPAGIPTDKRIGRRKAEACMRGSAKTTWWSQLDTIHGIVFGEEPYTLLIGASLTTARQILRDIRVEFEENELLRADFGNLVPAKGARVEEPVQVRLKGYKPTAVARRPMWAATAITTITNMKVEAVAAGAALRGRRHGRWRPTKVVIDDLETDKAAQSVDQRDYLEKWVKSAVLKIGDAYTNYIYIDTLKHADSVLVRILKGTGWQGRVRKAIIRVADNQALWEEWRKIYTDKVGYPDDAEREVAALAFFEAHREEMLAGTEVLWPEKPDRTYYALQKLRVDDGERAFDTEMQQEPGDEERQFFFPRYYDSPTSVPRDKLPWALWSDEFWSNTIGYGSLDPSLGRKKTVGDFSAILFGARSITTGLVYTVVADIQRRRPTEIKRDLFNHLRFFIDRGAPVHWLRAFGIEIVQFQEFFAEQTADDSAAAGLYIPYVPIESLDNKELRIESMEADVNNGYYLFSKDQQEMVKQLTRYRVDKYHDDGPDALEMMKRIITGRTGQATAALPVSTMPQSIKMKRR